MLMMLPSCLVKCEQSLGQMVLQHLESRGAMWPEMYPADAHDAPFLPGKMRASSRKSYIGSSAESLKSRSVRIFSLDTTTGDLQLSPEESYVTLEGLGA